jgi:hypothetical protein
MPKRYVFHSIILLVAYCPTCRAIHDTSDVIYTYFRMIRPSCPSCQPPYDEKPARRRIMLCRHTEREILPDYHFIPPIQTEREHA